MNGGGFPDRCIEKWKRAFAEVDLNEQASAIGKN
jgi:hypothetical protein